MRFGDEVVIVTGGASGIGMQTVRRFVSEGARVAVFDQDAAAGDHLIREIVADGGRAIACSVDVRNTAQVQSGVDRVLEEFGSIDVLVNNAALGEADDLVTIDDEAWEREVSTILGGAYRCARAVLPSMIGGGSGSIVNIGSVNGMAMYGQEAYSAAKAGVESLTRSIAVRYGPAGIRANAVAPATVETPAWKGRVEANPHIFEQLAAWYPLGRVGTPDDVASAILFLASNEASWITGTVLVVDGGLLAGGFRMFATAVGQDVGDV